MVSSHVAASATTAHGTSATASHRATAVVAIHASHAAVIVPRGGTASMTVAEATMTARCGVGAVAGHTIPGRATRVVRAWCVGATAYRCVATAAHIMATAHVVVAVAMVAHGAGTMIRAAAAMAYPVRSAVSHVVVSVAHAAARSPIASSVPAIGVSHHCVVHSAETSVPCGTTIVIVAGSKMDSSVPTAIIPEYGGAVVEVVAVRVVVENGEVPSATIPPYGTIEVVSGCKGCPLPVV